MPFKAGILHVRRLETNLLPSFPSAPCAPSPGLLALIAPSLQPDREMQAASPALLSAAVTTSSSRMFCHRDAVCSGPLSAGAQALLGY